MTKKIRTKVAKHSTQKLKGTVWEADPPKINRVLKLGDRGEIVEEVEEKGKIRQAISEAKKRQEITPQKAPASVNE